MQTSKITLNDKTYIAHTEFTMREGTMVVLNSNNELKIDAHFMLNILNEQTFKFQIIKLKTSKKEGIDDLIVQSLIEFFSQYAFQFHKDKTKAPIAVIENATPMEDGVTLPLLQFFPARDQVYISGYNTEVENEWLLQTSMIKDILESTYREFFRKTVIPKKFFLNEELLDTKISGHILNSGINYIFNHPDLFKDLTLLSPFARNLHYKHLIFNHVNMDVEHPTQLNARILNLKNIPKHKMTVSGHFFNFINCNASQISVSLDFLGQSPEHSLIYLEKFRYSDLRIYQQRHAQKGTTKPPFIFLKSCKGCEIFTRATTFFIIADNHKEKYENRSIIVDGPSDDIFHKIIYLTNNGVEMENYYKQNIPWEEMNNEEKMEVINTLSELIPALETRYKLKFKHIRETISKIDNDESHLEKVNSKSISQFLRNIHSLDPDHCIETVFKKKKH